MSGWNSHHSFISEPPDTLFDLDTVCETYGTVIVIDDTKCLRPGFSFLVIVHPNLVGVFPRNFQDVVILRSQATDEPRFFISTVSRKDFRHLIECLLGELQIIASLIQPFFEILFLPRHFQTLVWILEEHLPLNIIIVAVDKCRLSHHD